ncbi:MAG: amino-acid N-acetyltransferase [Pseudomonadales bacterium]|nr:amino-acid N-acetyltransferase [Pseudomonadales bacterium]
MLDYVKFFRETAPYTNMHRGKTFVILLRGESILHANFAHLVGDLALLAAQGIKVVLIHGAKPQVDRQLELRQIACYYQDQVRITDAEVMACVQEAVGSIRIAIEAALSMGVVNSPMQGARVRVVGGNFITAKPLGVRNGVDFQHSGEVRRIDRVGIRNHLDDGAIVLLSPVGYSPTGEVFNLTSEDVAVQAAISLQADKLILIGPDDGVRDAEGRLQKAISLRDVKGWLEQLATQPMLAASLRAGYQACLNGIQRSHLIGFAEDGALLAELFTRDGIGTLVLKDSAEVIRQATIDDIGGILELIQPLEESGVLVKRSRELLETEISRFHVVVHTEGTLIGCAALYPFAAQQAAELACVATHPEFANQGVGSRLLAHLEGVARNEHRLKRLFVLTTQAEHWFREKGFTPIGIEDLPAAKAELYNYQRRSKIFQKAL